MHFGVVIPAANRPNGAVEQLCCFFLRDAFIEEQVHNLSLLFWELSNSLVELSPFSKILWLFVEL